MYLKPDVNIMRVEDDYTIWALELVVPANSAISSYKSLVCECHECGAPYSKLEYDEESEIVIDDETGERYVKHCDNCDAILTGDTLE